MYTSFLAALVLTVFVDKDCPFAVASSDSISTKENVATAISSAGTQNTMTSSNDKSERSKIIDVVFSDLDGTLIHYPKNLQEYLLHRDSAGICILPPSSTGLVGVLSARTIQLVREIRQSGVKFVFVSGMRASTLLKRLPYLPKADAYCCESGGRIFYPNVIVSTDTYQVQPQTFVTATADDMRPFSLIEDTSWRAIMEDVNAAGKDGYAGQDIKTDNKKENFVIPFDERSGLLWDFARSLSAQGYILDTVGYSTCFRVNRKQQTNSELFDLLRSTELPPGLSSSTNLGCVDFYPAASGKKNCCDRVYSKFGFTDSIASRCICLCDDDNDLEMAMSCLHTYVPLVSSISMEKAVQEHPDKFTVTASTNDINDNIESSEAALKLVLQRIFL